jgi:DNA replication and repair protein RecF
MEQCNKITMSLSRILLSHFRSYDAADFSFSAEITTIVGPNTAGKSNLLEAMYLLAIGKSYRAEKDIQMIEIGEEIMRVKGLLRDGEEKKTLEVVLAIGSANPSPNTAYSKKYFVNDISRRRKDFSGHLTAVLFTPSDLDIIVTAPSLRRAFLDDVLLQVDYDYATAHGAYEKALRQRNALLEIVRETGNPKEEQFRYWDELVITNGQLITQKRQEFIDYMNEAQKDISHCQIQYDHSSISEERLAQYKDAERASGVTLVGPHRDDFSVSTLNNLGQARNVKAFGSRGQQRLVVLQMKLLQLQYIDEKKHQRPLLLLDDIFSELDDTHISLVSDIIKLQQTILTTTHTEFVGANLKEHGEVILLQTEPSRND